jgi:hypothetical protein
MRHLTIIVVGIVCLTGWQHLDGQYLWWRDGVLVSPLSDSNAGPGIAEDGTGGVFVGWVDTRTGTKEAYVQRIDSTGSRLWGDAGRMVRTDTGSHNSPHVIPDGQGGMIVLWNDLRISSCCQVFGQRFDPTGNPMWESLGTPITTSGSILDVTRVRGTTLIEAHYSSGIYIQRVDLQGAVPFPQGWCVEPSGGGRGPYPQFEALAADTGQGAYVAWFDWYQEGNPPHYYCDIVEGWSHIDRNGHRLFTRSPHAWYYIWSSWYEPLISLCAADSGRVALLTRDGAVTEWLTGQVAGDSGQLWSVSGIMGSTLVPDGTGGYLTNGRSRVQRFNESGKLWGDTGVVVDDSASYPVIAGDDSGGVIVCYLQGANARLWARRINAGGESAWCVPLSLAGNPVRHYRIINDSCGDAIAVWIERRAGTWALYAQRLDIHGIGGVTQSPPARLGAELGSRLVSANPNPLRGSCRIRCYLRPTKQPATIGVYSVSGSRVRALRLPAGASGYADASWNGAIQAGATAPPGTYFFRLDDAPASPVLKLVKTR